MKRPITCRYICFLFLISLACTTSQAQQQKQKKEKAPLFGGVAVSADIVGFAMKAVGAKFANMEVAGRINLRDKFFPVAELGIGDCHRDGAETGNSFSTTSPYMRFGLDYNFNKKHNGNRLFGIVRYGFSSFKNDKTTHAKWRESNSTMAGVWCRCRDEALEVHSTWLEHTLQVQAKLEDP